jgi:hypothetical protein
MQRFMKKSNAAIIILVIAIVVGITISVLMLNLFNGAIGPPNDFNYPRFRQNLDFYLNAKIVISFVNIVLACSLLVVYVDLVRKVKSSFTVGLILMTVALLLYAITSNPVIHALFGFRFLGGEGPFTMIADIFASAALFILLWLSLE